VVVEEVVGVVGVVVGVVVELVVVGVVVELVVLDVVVGVVVLIAVVEGVLVTVLEVVGVLDVEVDVVRWQSRAASREAVATPSARSVRSVRLTVSGSCCTWLLSLFARLSAAMQSWLATAEES
jgi:hypothetical protein